MTTVTGLLHYSSPLVPGGREDNWTIDAVSQAPDTVYNFRSVSKQTVITDLRTIDLRPTLDGMGFTKLPESTHVDQHALSQNSAVSVEQYERELDVLLKDLTGADEVVVFDTTLRREDTQASPDSTYRPAHLRVHVDQNPNSARVRAVKHGGPERHFRRFQIVNVWRPLIEPVRNFPLALCDYTSVNVTRDLVPTRLRFPPWLKDQENYSVKHSPDHRWFYWASLTPDEALVFKIYDSASRELALHAGCMNSGHLLDVAGLCPHSAFFDERGPTTGCLRVSIEVRALLFYN